MRRSRCNVAEAVTFREETDEGTGEASRDKGPGTYGGIAEIASGRATSQQGLVTTCRDPSSKVVGSGLRYRNLGDGFK